MIKVNVGCLAVISFNFDFQLSGKLSLSLETMVISP
jgi:hypothetical protein